MSNFKFEVMVQAHILVDIDFRQHESRPCHLEVICVVNNSVDKCEYIIF